MIFQINPLVAMGVLASIISYTENAVYVLFAAMGSWLGAFASVTWLGRGRTGDAMERHNPP
jgi:hypothetical protein